MKQIQMIKRILAITLIFQIVFLNVIQCNAEDIMEVNANQKIAYLTFDDGPSVNTNDILDILKKENIKATFFVKGNNTDGGRKAYKRIVNEGHSIGNHTFSHEYNYIYKSKDNFIRDFNKLQRLIKDTTGVTPTMIRFPGGSNNTISHKYGGKNIMNELVAYAKSNNLYYVDWNVDSGDAAVTTEKKDKIIENVRIESSYSDKIIVLMHDAGSKKTTVEALPQIIKDLRSKGFEFRPLKAEEYTVKFIK